MLICPHCTFENPDQNRFCQQCGYALQIWRAIVIPRLKSQLSENSDGAGGSETASANPSDEINPTPVEKLTTFPPLKALFPEMPYLDRQHRYQFQEKSVSQVMPGVATFKVIDCQPATVSPLSTLTDPETVKPDVDAAQAISGVVPTEAVPYLVLQNQFFPTVPTLHHAWETPDYAVLLVEDREPWSLLGDMWKLGAVDPLQQLHWFYKMSELWEALEPWNGQVSLLDPANLRVDEDQIFCLTYLQRGNSDSSFGLAALGKVWQGLIDPAQDVVPSALHQLIDAVAANQLASVAELQTQLVHLADAFQERQDAEKASGSSEITPEEPAIAPAGAISEDSSSPLPNNVEPAEWADDPAEPREDGFGDTSPVDLSEDTEEPPDIPTMVLPMKIVRLDEAGSTHVGRQRDHNEDFFCTQTELTKTESPQGVTLSVKGLYVLCDGMGGHASGEVASSLAVKTLQTYFAQHPLDTFPDEALLLEAVAQANEAIYQINQEDARSGNSRMGTTLVMLLLRNDRAVVAHVGDSRLYRYTRRTGLKQVTVDHEVGQREIQRGVEPAIAYARPDAYQLTQALGPRSSADLKPGITFLDVPEDTLFILCSDGLSDNDLLEQYCSSHIEPLLHSQVDLEEGVSQLIELANEHNGHDNITAILVRVKFRPSMDKLPAV
ncbi:MAG TPA: serine/threonine phosphatase [Leptolyngbyaceae cyanobacterium]